MGRIKDEDLLVLLEQNARTPATHLATELGVTETAVRKRISKLEEQGIITQHTIRISPKKSKYTIVFIGIDTKPESYMQITHKLAVQKPVKRMYSMSGDHQLQLECWFHNREELVAFTQELEEDNNITRVCPGIIQEQIK